MEKEADPDDPARFLNVLLSLIVLLNYYGYEILLHNAREQLGSTVLSFPYTGIVLYTWTYNLQ